MAFAFQRLGFKKFRKLFSALLGELNMFLKVGTKYLTIPLAFHHNSSSYCSFWQFSSRKQRNAREEVQERMSTFPIYFLPLTPNDLSRKFNPMQEKSKYKKVKMKGWTTSETNPAWLCNNWLKNYCSVCTDIKIPTICSLRPQWKCSVLTYDPPFTLLFVYWGQSYTWDSLQHTQK